jgi:molecular chaperone Hsp33
MTAVLGRTMSAASLIGSLLKDKTDSVTLRIDGDGPAGRIIAVSDYKGNVRVCADNYDAELPPNALGKLDVGGAVGRGNLYVIRDLGLAEPYVGSAELVSGEIAEDITNYYATSEQIPTVCALGVLIDKESHQVLLSGGLLIQLLPGADDNTISKIEANVNVLDPVTTMLAKGMSALDMCKAALQGFEVEVLDEFEVKYVCGCSKEKIASLIAAMPPEEITAMIEQDHGARANCRFCRKEYVFSEDELRAMLR